MANKLFKSLFAVAMVLGSALGFVACEEPNEVVGDPTVEVSTKSLNFTNEEGSQEVEITCNVDWTATVDADWITVAPAAGSKNGTITVAVSANETGAIRTATVRVSAIHPQYNEEWDNKKITVQQSADENVTVTEELLYSDDFDGKEATKTYGSGSSWPYIDQFPEFANAEGDAAANVTYTGSGVSVRANSTSNSSYSDYAGSGSNNIFFGGGAYFQVNTIAPLEGVNYKVTFGTEKYTQDGDSTFKPEEFLMYISKDGEKWAPVEYTFAGTEPGRWNVATANFTLKAATETLYIKFEAKVASVYRLDDLKLYTGNGGQEIDLDNIQEPEPPTPPTTDALYFENFDGKAAVKDGNYWPYVTDFPEMKNAAGVAAANVSYDGHNTTVRNNSNSDGSYSDYAGSGLNNIFFGKVENHFTIKGLALESSNKNLTLTFGTEKYSQTLGSKFTPSEFIVSLSADGEKWTSIDYTFAGTAEGRWNVATANFTLKEVPATLYIKFSATAESAYRLDDVTLEMGDGGQEIDLANGTQNPGGGEEPDQPENPDQPNVPANGIYESDSAFVCTTDDSTNAAYSLGATTINGEAVTGFKLGKSKQAGKFTSGAVGVEGAKYLNFYAQGWKGGDVTLYFRVDGGATQSVKLASHDGVTGNPPYTALAFADTDHYSFLLEGLTASSKIEFSTDANFALTTADSTMASARAIVCGMKLSDEANGNEGGNENPTPEPEPEPEPTPDTMTIADVLAKGNGATIGGVIEGVVVSNLDLNNLTSKKGMYVQDETGALQFYLAANHTFAFGTKVRIDLTTATLGSYNGAVQVSGVALDKIEVISTGNTVEAKTVSVTDFLANKYEGQYIALEGVQVAESDLSKTWVMGGAHTSINMEDAAGNKFVVFSSKYASYGAETVAQGSGVIKGISSINNGTMQIIFAQASDFAGLTGERFGNTTPEPDPTPDPEPTPEPEPGTGATATIYFDNIANRTAFSTEQQVWEQNGITVTNDKAASTSNVGDYYNPARFYKNSNVTVEADAAFSQIVFNCDDYKATYVTDLQASFSSGKVSVDGTTLTVTLNSAATSYAITNLAGQVRVDSITVVYAE
ncbi:MAG: BACON domain-containing protein [Alistipes sp.]|nr:BACON domain-containing protein [Alistipes sp.]